MLFDGNLVRDLWDCIEGEVQCLKEVLLNHPFCDRGRVLWQSCFSSAWLWGSWLERNSKISVGRVVWDVLWDTIRFNSSLLMPANTVFS